MSLALCWTPAVPVPMIWEVVIKSTWKTEFSLSNIATSWTQAFVANLLPQRWGKVVVSLISGLKDYSFTFSPERCSSDWGFFLEFCKLALWNTLLKTGSWGRLVWPVPLPAVRTQRAWKLKSLGLLCNVLRQRPRMLKRVVRRRVILKSYWICTVTWSNAC